MLLRFCQHLLALACSSLALLGQATGTIGGTVKDSTGAAIAGAEVTATNAGTNASRVAVTDSGGQFSFPALPTGAYEIRVAIAGFTPFLQKAITLEPNTQSQIDVALKVKSETEQVTVSDTPTVLQTSSSTLVQVVDAKRVSDLPLNGRNILQLISLNAGVSDRRVPVTVQGANLGQFGGGNFLNNVSINGSRGNSTNFLLDNADNNEPQTNLARPFPNVDAVQEFSVQTSSFDAQYGRGVGGIVNVVTKSGTNRFHGTAFEFLRNYQLNARNFFSGRDAIKRNQFGGGIGGPISKNRTFFFASYQGTEIRSNTPGVVRTAPSRQMKNGDFSAWLVGDRGALRDPASPGIYFPNNLIPPTRFDPVAAKLAALVPSSTDSTYQVRFGTPTGRVTDRQFVGRGDHSFNDKHRISARYFMLYYDSPALMIPTNLLFAADGQVGYSQSTAFNYTNVISAKWINNVTFSYSTSVPERTIANDAKVSLESLGANVKSAPGINVLDVGVSGWSGMANGNAGITITRSSHLANVASYATGRHNIRFGGEARFYRSGIDSYFLTGGSSSFSGQLISDPGRQNAGAAYAEFLLGLATSWRQLSISRSRMQQNLPSLFVQEDFRLTDRFTINAGLRWDPKPGLQDGLGQHTTFIAGQQSTVFPKAPLGLLFTGDPQVGDSVIEPYWKALAPRIGFAWKASGKTAVRGGYGLFYDEYMGLMYNRTVQGQPWVSDATLIGPIQLSNPYAASTVLDPAGYKPDPNQTIRDFSTYAVPTSAIRPGYMQNWNFLIEREIASGMLARIAYVGSKGTHLLNTIDVNPGIFAPGATASNLNQRRPYTRIGQLAMGNSNGNSSYNGLQVTVQRRYAAGFSVLANYTWSKAIDYSSFGSIEGNQTGPDPFNIRNNRGPAEFDVTHRFVLSGVWQLPTLGQSHRMVRAVLGGWQSNGILTAQTGNPLTVRSGVNNALNGVGNDFADYLGGDWRLPSDRPKKDEIAKWFDTSRFTTNRIGTIGTARRGQLRSPGDWNVDFSLFKSFKPLEQLRAEFRGEFFNVLNHANLNEPNASVTSPIFGVITSASSPRIIQVAVKLIF